MRHLLPFLACLMLVLTGWASMAHAAEAAGGSIAGIEFGIHTRGDADEVVGDDDNALPHHHATCHGHDVGTPATNVGGMVSGTDLRLRIDRRADDRAGILARVLPRPPRA
ncbi:hypothetical protein [Sphingomonas panni]|uniref:hypothetical protein n=1 Tax=Sphingomonas panni TaxID=237612 RepID=UPI001F5B8F32|nr:hypothetical protein [Sphingomonas panni]